MNRRNHSFVMESKLHDVRGRVDYISSPKRQENLYAVFSNVEANYWELLSDQNQRDFAKSGTEGKCIEARELIIMLPPSLIQYDHELLLKYITANFLEKYDVGCCAALHHNKKKTNLHIHLIFSEREIQKEVERKVASRNMFYNESGKHVRTKKEILDEEGNVRPGCKIIPKGEVYETNYFQPKMAKFKSRAFLDQMKLLSNPDIIEASDNVPKELIGTWEAKAGRKVEIFEDGKVYWTYNASGSIYTGYIGTINDYSIVLSKEYEGNGKGNYQSMSEISEAELQDTYIIYDITMHGDTAFSAQNVDSREYAWSFIKSE